MIQRALVLARDDVLRLPGRLAPEARREYGHDRGHDDTLPLAEQLRRFKIERIRAALEASGGNQRIAAERLGLHRQSLTRMIHELGLRGE